MSLIRPTWMPSVGTPPRSPGVDRYLGLAPEQPVQPQAQELPEQAEDTGGDYSSREYSPQTEDSVSPVRNSFVRLLSGELGDMLSQFGFWGDEQDFRQESMIRSELGREQSFSSRWGGR